MPAASALRLSSPWSVRQPWQTAWRELSSKSQCSPGSAGPRLPTPKERLHSSDHPPPPEVSLGVARKFSLPLPGLGVTSVATFGSPGDTYHLVVVAVGDVGLLEKGAEGCLQRERLCLPSKTRCPTIPERQGELRSSSVPEAIT